MSSRVYIFARKNRSECWKSLIKGCDFVTAQQGLRGYDTQTLLGPHWHFIRATPLPTELRGSVKLSENHTETLNFRVRWSEVSISSSRSRFSRMQLRKYLFSYRASCVMNMSLIHVIMLLFMDESGSRWRDGDEIATGAKGWNGAHSVVSFELLQV